MDRKAPTKTASDEVERRLDEIKDAKKRETDFRKDGERVLKIYSADDAWSTVNVLRDYLQPDLTIICLGINDWMAATNLVTWTTTYQALIDAAKLTGDVIICTPVPSATSVASEALQRSYVNAAIQLAENNDLLYVDVFNRFGDYTTANASGYMVDTAHPNDVGYSDCVTAEMQILRYII